tara:strand:- start:45 stop:296 length:252 start_codon:yes stop_codon:yes gene_type:complete
MDNIIEFPNKQESADAKSKRLLEDMTYVILKMIDNEGFDVNDRAFKRDMGSWIKFLKIAIDRQLGADDESLERIKRVNVDLDK